MSSGGPDAHPIGIDFGGSGIKGAPVDLVKAYLSYVIGAEGQSLAAESAGSAPISEALFTEAQAAIDAIK